MIRQRLSALFLLLLGSCWLFSVQARTLKIATVSPDGSAWMKSMRLAGKEIAEKTDKRVKLKFYPGGVMGSDQTVLRKIRAGQLHGAAMTAGSLLPSYPDIALYTLPAIFQSLEEVDAIRAELDKTLLQGLAEQGFITFGFAEAGFAYVLSKKPVRNLIDLAANKLWVPDNDSTMQQVAESFRINPTPLPLADVLTGLQTGLINTVAVPPLGAVILQWHTQLDYLLDLPLFYLFGILTIEKKSFHKLSAADRVIVQKILSRTFKEIGQKNRADSNEALEVLLQNGIKKLKPNDKDVAEWRQRSHLYANNLMAAGKLSRPLFERMNELLARYRQQKLSH